MAIAFADGFVAGGVSESEGDPSSVVVDMSDSFDCTAWATSVSTALNSVQGPFDKAQEALQKFDAEVTLIGKVNLEFLAKWMNGTFAQVSPVADPEPTTDEERQQRTTDRARRRMATLAYVNKVRRDFGLNPIDALVPGRKGDQFGCVIARSIKSDGGELLNVMVGGYSAEVTSLTDAYPVMRKYVHEADVAAFVQDFDRAVHEDLLTADPADTSALDGALASLTNADSIVDSIEAAPAPEPAPEG